MREEDPFDSTDSPAEHGSNEERWRKHSTGRAAGERENSRKNLQSRKNSQDLPCELVVHGAVDELVPCAHHLGTSGPADSSDDQSCDGRLQELRPARERLHAGTQNLNRLAEDNRSERSHDTQG